MSVTVLPSAKLHRVNFTGRLCRRTDGRTAFKSHPIKPAVLIDRQTRAALLMVPPELIKTSKNTQLLLLLLRRSAHTPKR